MTKQISIQIINQFLSLVGTFLFLQGTALSLVWMFPEPAPATVRCGTETAPKDYRAFSTLFPVRGGVNFNWSFPSPGLRTTKRFVSSTLLLIGYISFNDESHPLPWIIPYFRSNYMSICDFYLINSQIIFRYWLLSSWSGSIARFWTQRLETYHDISPHYQPYQDANSPMQLLIHPTRSKYTLQPLVIPSWTSLLSTIFSRRHPQSQQYSSSTPMIPVLSLVETRIHGWKWIFEDWPSSVMILQA